MVRSTRSCRPKCSAVPAPVRPRTPTRSTSCSEPKGSARTKCRRSVSRSWGELVITSARASTASRTSTGIGTRTGIGALIVAQFVTVWARMRYAARLFPLEMAHIGTTEARRAAIQRANPFRATVAWRMSLLTAQIVLAWSLSRFLTSVLPIGAGYLNGFVLAVILILSALGEIAVAKRSIARDLRRALIEQGISVCMHCGYDLRGQVNRTCPECGAAFEEK